MPVAPRHVAVALRIGSRHALGVALAVVVSAVCAVPAVAGTVAVSGDTVTYVDSDGEAQDLWAAYDSGAYYFLDFHASLTAGAGCAANSGPPLGSYTVRCADTGITSVAVDAGAGDDVVHVGSVAAHAVVEGGAGNDHLAGGQGSDTLRGGDGDDLLDDNSVSGAPAQGDDEFSGGPGTDTVSYQYTFEPVHVTLDDVADDGVAGSADNARADIENVLGGGSADVLTGNAHANRLEGGSGLEPNVLNGLGGDDVLIGAGGDGDVLNGGDDDDQLDGGWGADTANGGPGDDTFQDTGLINGSLSDTFNGGAGEDTADYSDRVGPVVADLDGQPGDDGELAHDSQPAEQDTLGADVENLIGGRAGDTLIGNDSANVLVGGRCDVPGSTGCAADDLAGAGGDDVLIAGDQSSGCPGAVCGTHGTANLDGGAGDDVLSDLYGAAEMTGGAGDDELTPAVDGELAGTVLSGGPGRDLVDFSANPSPVSVSLDDVADDGPAGADENARADLEDVLGSDGDDVLAGNARDNLLVGGAGDDILAGAAGADELSGDAGEDVADYTDHRAAVTVRFNGQASSGGAEDGAGDTIHGDVEDAWGGDGNDTLIGGNAPNLLNGGPGADTLVGGGGEDAADYSERAQGVSVAPDGTANSGDASDGAPGARDTVAADIEDVYGGDGPDRLWGNARVNFLDAGAGADILDSRDTGGDELACGEGSDLARIDALDVYGDDCEQLQLPPSPAGASPSAASAAGLAVTLRLPRGQRLKSMLAKGLRLRATCSTRCALNGAALMSARKLGLKSAKRTVRIARGTRDLDHAGTTTLTLRFTRPARKRLRRLHTATMAIRVTAMDGSASQTLTRRLRVTRKRARLLAASANASLVRRPARPRMKAAVATR